MPPGYYFTGYSSVDQPVININAETEVCELHPSCILRGGKERKIDRKFVIESESGLGEVCRNK